MPEVCGGTRPPDVRPARDRRVRRARRTSERSALRVLPAAAPEARLLTAGGDHSVMKRPGPSLRLLLIGVTAPAAWSR
jgi:hypothetical protein